MNAEQLQKKIAQVIREIKHSADGSHSVNTLMLFAETYAAHITQTLTLERDTLKKQVAELERRCDWDHDHVMERFYGKS